MMRIQEMVDYLEDKGFTVHKKWIGTISKYLFTIQRGKEN